MMKEDNGIFFSIEAAFGLIPIKIIIMTVSIQILIILILIWKNNIFKRHKIQQN